MHSLELSVLRRNKNSSIPSIFPKQETSFIEHTGLELLKASEIIDKYHATQRRKSEKYSDGKWHDKLRNFCQPPSQTMDSRRPRRNTDGAITNLDQGIRREPINPSLPGVFFIVFVYEYYENFLFKGSWCEQ